MSSAGYIALIHYLSLVINSAKQPTSEGWSAAENLHKCVGAQKVCDLRCIYLRAPLLR